MAVFKLSTGYAKHAGAKFWNLFTGMAVLKLSMTMLKLSRGYAECAGAKF